MRAIFIAAIVICLASATVGGQSGNDLFQKALSKERAEGQLTEAIALYERIVKDFASDRALAAKALLQMGRCYERLGKSEAQQAYERVLREYGDQRAAADDARVRIAALARPRAGGMSSRHVWTLPGSGTITGTVSRGGRYVPYTDWSVPKGKGGELFLHDLQSGANRQLTNDVKPIGVQFVEGGGTFSADDTEFAYALYNTDHRELRIVGVQGPVIQRPRVLYSNPEVTLISPDDWSRDGKWLAVQIQRKDKTAQIGLVAVHDGALRVLKSVDWRGSSKLFFSPDNKHLAYDLPAADAGDQRDVFVLAIDGSRETAAVVHPGNDVLVGWSPDGGYLLFTSDRAGSTGLWALRVADGRPQGAPQQIKADVAGTSMGVTSSGTLHAFIKHPSFNALIRSDIQVAAFDFATGRFSSPPATVVHTLVGANNSPSWSPDGKSLAFLSRRGLMADGTTDTVIGILSEETGRVRELRAQLSIYVGGASLRWSPDGRSLAIRGADVKGRQGLFRIDVATGEASPIVLASGGDRFDGPMWAADGRTIYYVRLDPAGGVAAIAARDLSSGDERELFRTTFAARGNPWMFVDLSPDGRYFAVVDNDAWPGHNAGPWTAALIPVAGGDAKELMRGESLGASVLTWAPDSRSFLVSSIQDPAVRDREVWRVAIDGTAPQKLRWPVSGLGPPFSSDQQLHLHPDGKRVAFAATEPAKPFEVWALENFLPAPVRPTTGGRR
jgi:Tol biopolymer transport system component